MNFESMSDEQLAEITGDSESVTPNNDPDAIDFRSMSDEQLGEVVSEFDPESLALSRHPSNFDSDVGVGEYLWNKAQEGFSASSSMIAAIGQTMRDPEQDFVTFNDDGSMRLVRGGEESAWEGFSRNYEAAQKMASEFTGADPDMKAPDELTRTMGSGVEALADPTNLAFGPLKAVALPAFSSGVFADIGGQIGGELSPEGAIAGTVIGGSVGGLTNIPTRSSLKGIGSANKIYKKWSAKGANIDESGIKGSAAKSLLKRISEEQGIDKLQSLSNDLSKAGDLIDHKSMPLLFALSGSPAARQEVMRLARTKPEFMQYMNNELGLVALKIDDYLEKAIGARSARVGHPAEYSKSQNKRIDGQRKKIRAIEQTLGATLNKMDTGVEGAELGSRVQKLLAQKKAAIKSELSPAYDAIKSDARLAKATMPADAVNSIYNYVKVEKVRDLFGEGSPLDGKIMSFLAPRKVEGGVAHPKLTFEQVDSLKRSINSIKRRNLTDDQRYLLSNLNEIVLKARDQIPGDFNKRLKAIDKLYYERIGVPFEDAKGVRQAMSPKKFATEVAPYIVKDAEKLQQFLDVTGAQGQKIASDAIYSKLYYAAANDGVVIPKKVRAFMQKNREVIARVPNLERELADIVTDQSRLMLRMGRMKDSVRSQEDVIAKSFLSQVSGTTLTPDYDSLARGIINKTSRVDEVLGSIKTLSRTEADAVISSLRRAMIDVASNQPDMSKFWTDPSNARAISAVMGKKHYNNIKYISKLKDSGRKADVSRASHTMKTEEPTNIAGVPATRWLAIWRNYLMSPTQKVAIGASDIYRGNRAKVIDDSLMEALKDPDGLERLVNIAKKAPKGQMSLAKDALLKDFMATLAEVVPVTFYTATKEGIKEGGEQSNEPESNFEMIETRLR